MLGQRRSIGPLSGKHSRDKWSSWMEMTDTSKWSSTSQPTGNQFLIITTSLTVKNRLSGSGQAWNMANPAMVSREIWRINGLVRERSLYTPKWNRVIWKPVTSGQRLTFVLYQLIPPPLDLLPGQHLQHKINVKPALINVVPNMARFCCLSLTLL